MIWCDETWFIREDSRLLIQPSSDISDRLSKTPTVPRKRPGSLSSSLSAYLKKRPASRLGPPTGTWNGLLFPRFCFGQDNVELITDRSGGEIFLQNGKIFYEGLLRCNPRTYISHRDAEKRAPFVKGFVLRLKDLMLKGLRRKNSFLDTSGG